MKPINSKERSKQLWQFVFIFFGLAVIPVSLIFFSYYKVPEEISEAESRKLIDYSKFEHTQKLILQKMIEIDSNIGVYATATTENTKLLERKILDGLSDLAKMDTSVKMLRLVQQSYEHHYNHVADLVKAQENYKNTLSKLQETQDDLKAAARANPTMGIPFPPTQ